MAQYFTDFSEYATGAQPSDWTERWNNSNTPWSVQVGPAGTTGTNALRFSLAVASNIRRALSWDTIGTITGTVEVVSRWQRASAGETNIILPAVLCIGGTSGSESAYATRDSGSSKDQARYASGVFTSLGSISFSATNGTWYWSRLQRTSAGTIRFRQWQDGTAEPSTWDVSTTDTGLSSGFAGVGMFGNDQVVWFDKVGIGTAGDAAPTEPFIAPVVTGSIVITGDHVMTMSGQEAPGVSGAIAITGDHLMTLSGGQNESLRRTSSLVDPSSHITVTIRMPYPDLTPIGSFQINPRLTALSFDTDFGGYGRLRIGYTARTARGEQQFAFLPEPVEAPDMADVTVHYGGSAVYEGVLTRVLPNRTGLEAVGYGQWAPQYGTITVGGDAVATSGVMVAEALAVTPWLTVGEIVDPGVRHLWEDVQDRKASDVISQMAEEGGLYGSKYRKWMFTVYENRLARFVPMVPAALPVLTTGYDPATMEIGWDYSRRIDAVRIVFQDRNGNRRIAPERGWFTRPGVNAASPYLRREQLSASADSADVAVALALTHLEQHSEIELSGSIVFSNWKQMHLRYGDTINIEGYGSSIVTQSQVDFFSGVTKITLGTPSVSSMPGFLRKVDRTVRSVQSAADPVSLGRMPISRHRSRLTREEIIELIDSRIGR